MVPLAVSNANFSVHTYDVHKWHLLGQTGPLTLKTTSTYVFSSSRKYCQSPDMETVRAVRSAVLLLQDDVRICTEVLHTSALPLSLSSRSRTDSVELYEQGRRPKPICIYSGCSIHAVHSDSETGISHSLPVQAARTCFTVQLEQRERTACLLVVAYGVSLHQVGREVFLPGSD